MKLKKFITFVWSNPNVGDTYGMASLINPDRPSNSYTRLGAKM